MIKGPMFGQKFIIIGATAITNFGFIQSHISSVCNGKLKTHGGCKWKYVSHSDLDMYQRNPSPEQLVYLGK